MIYSVGAGSKPDTLNVADAGSVALAGSYVSITPVTVKGSTYALGFDPTSDSIDVYTFSVKAPFLHKLSTKLAVGKGRDILNVFTLANTPYLVMYTANSGVFEVYAIHDDLTPSAKPYKFFRNHEMALSQGFTTLKPFVCQGQVGFLGYRGDTGYVALYTAATIPAAADPTKPPILMLPVWAHQWAKGWTRFALFQFGGSNFFLKTNTWKPNVNIDHILDQLSAGTAEVGSLVGAEATTLPLQDLKDAQTLTTCEPFTFGNGDPYFATYESKNGEITLNRFHGNCLGWTTVATVAGKKGCKLLTAVAVSPTSLYLIIV
jgi:hypothetical protein